MLVGKSFMFFFPDGILVFLAFRHKKLLISYAPISFFFFFSYHYYLFVSLIISNTPYSTCERAFQMRCLIKFLSSAASSTFSTLEYTLSVFFGCIF